MVLVVTVDQISDICDLGKILGLTPINSIFTIWRINRGQPLKIDQKLKNQQLPALNLVKLIKNIVQ